MKGYASLGFPINSNSKNPIVKLDFKKKVIFIYSFALLTDFILRNHFKLQLSNDLSNKTVYALRGGGKEDIDIASLVILIVSCVSCFSYLFPSRAGNAAIEGAKVLFNIRLLLIILVALEIVRLIVRGLSK